MILFYFTTENLAKQNSCTQILLFWYVNRIVEPKAWVSSFSYQWITLFQIFGFSLLLLAHLAHLTVHPHRQLSFSQTKDDDDTHQDCDHQCQHKRPPKHKNCQWKTFKKINSLDDMYLPWWRCFVIFQAFLGNSFILKKKKLHENISWRHMMTKCHLYSVYLEFWIRDNVSERTHSPPQDDCKS